MYLVLKYCLCALGLVAMCGVGVTSFLVFCDFGCFVLDVAGFDG